MATHRSGGNGENNERKQRNDDDDDDDLLEEEGRKKKEEGRGKIEWTNGVKKREPRFRKYACVRAGARANMCSGAKLAELEPNAGIFDFCGHARNF